MITVRINDRDYIIKTEWKEFTYSEYQKIVLAGEKGLEERLSVYTGIEKDIIEKLTMQQITFISNAIAFVDEPENAFIFSNGYIDDLNIGRRTYKELEQCLIFIRKSGKPVVVFDKILEIYYGEHIGGSRVTEILGKGAFVIDLINKFLLEFKKLGEYELSAEEIEAGVEELGKFGFFATAVQMARKYGKTHDEILAMPAREVYTTLLYDFEQSEVEKRLNNIRIRNSKK